ncbi:MAG: M28 family peptidase [Gammaproteobacteria bacterium]|nr:M28 family peptidase [Gammaproteobacteria bacterium]
MITRTSWLLVVAFVLVACTELRDVPVRVADPLVGPLTDIDAKFLHAHVAWLSDDKRQGRMTGEPGYDASAAYVAAQFREFGLQPGADPDGNPDDDDAWFQQVPLVRYQLNTETPSVVIHRNDKDRELIYREHYGMSPDKVRETNSVRADVVYVGYGVHAPEFSYSDYDGIDVRGKIVALFGGAPSTFSHAQRAYYASSRTKAQEAVARGAIGSVGLRSRRIQEQTPWERFKQLTGKRPGMAWVSETGAASGYFPELKGGIVISAATATELFAASPISFEQALDAAAADTPASTPLDFEVTLSRQTSHDRIESPNVIGIVRGSDPEFADEFVVYTAHLDHVGISPAPETDDDINNGAYDNAMGISIMLETAKIFGEHPPARSVMFVAVTAEERGLLGSDYFAHYPTVPMANIVANVNLDMPLFLYPIADLVAFGSEHSSLEPVVEAAAESEGFSLTPNPLPEENLFVRSDQYSFVKKGIPAIYLIPGFTSSDPEIDGEAQFREHLKDHYHEPSDDLTRPVDWESVVRFTRSHIRIGYYIANDAARPTWNEGDFFGERFGPN